MIKLWHDLDLIVTIDQVEPPTITSCGLLYQGSLLPASALRIEVSGEHADRLRAEFESLLWNKNSPTQVWFGDTARTLCFYLGKELARSIC